MNYSEFTIGNIFLGTYVLCTSYFSIHTGEWELPVLGVIIVAFRVFFYLRKGIKK